MTKEITLEEALKLVNFTFSKYQEWQVQDVKTSILGNVWGDVGGYIKGDVRTVGGSVWSRVKGNVNTIEGVVWNTINGKAWQPGETIKEKLHRLVAQGATKEELHTVINQLEDD